MESQLLDLRHDALKRPDIARLMDMFRVNYAYDMQAKSGYFDDMPTDFDLTISDGVSVKATAYGVFASFDLVVIKATIYGGLDISGYTGDYRALIALGPRDNKLFLMWDPADEEAYLDVTLAQLMAAFPHPELLP